MQKNFKEISVGGFGLVQVMIAVGLLGMIAVGVMQVSKQMQTTAVSGETSIEENQLLSHISTVLIDSDSCKETFIGMEIGKPIESIKRVKASGEKLEVYKTGEKYGNRTLLLKGMNLSGTEGEENLELTLERIKQGVSGAKEIKKRIPLKLVIKDGKVADCFNDLSNVTENSIKKSCESVGAEYDPATQKCKNLKLNGDEAQVCVGGNCKSIKNFVEDLVIEVNKKTTVCLVKYNPLLGFVNNRLDLSANKCFATKSDGGAVSCSINSDLTDCN
jgi:hypothetical protein